MTDNNTQTQSNMAYQNTGYARNTTLTVTKGEYSRSYSILDTFDDPADDTGYPVLQQEDFQRLSDPEYEMRLQAFCRHVYASENGLEADCPDLTRGSVEYNTTLCRIALVADSNEPTQE